MNQLGYYGKIGKETVKNIGKVVGGIILIPTGFTLYSLPGFFAAPTIGRKIHEGLDDFYGIGIGVAFFGGLLLTVSGFENISRNDHLGYLKLIPLATNTLSALYEVAIYSKKKVDKEIQKNSDSLENKVG